MVWAWACCVSCNLKLPTADFLNHPEADIELRRLDRLQSRYVTTGDFSALQQMETDYPMETRVLIEKVLRVGVVDDPDISRKFLRYFQDSTLQALVNDVEAEYARVDDINNSLQDAFAVLLKDIPDLKVPRFYTQIGALDESIVVGDDMVGISLDKYLGKNYPLYKKHYSLQERESMTRDNIVPECLCFYLLSLYPLADFESRAQNERDFHMGKMMWVCNYALKKRFFDLKIVEDVEKYQAEHKLSVQQLLGMEYWGAARSKRKSGAPGIEKSCVMKPPATAFYMPRDL